MLDKIGYYSLECWGGATFDSLPALPERRPVGAPAQAAQGSAQHQAADAASAARTSWATSTMPTTWWSEFVRHVASKNGIDIIRIFDALNDMRNLETAIKATKKYGGICEVAMSYTVSPVHTEDYFVKLAAADRGDGRGHHLHQGHGQPAAALQGLQPGQAPEGGTSEIPIHLHTHNTTGTGDMTPAQGHRGRRGHRGHLPCRPLGNGTSQPATESTGGHPAGHRARHRSGSEGSDRDRRALPRRGRRA